MPEGNQGKGQDEESQHGQNHQADGRDGKLAERLQGFVHPLILPAAPAPRP